MPAMDESDAVSLVALIISIIALIGTILQLLQQYFSSAEGFSNCGEQVVGQWSLYRARKFRWTELRFEVQFEVPVMFVCPATNEKGPLPGQPLWHVNGTPQSEADTRTPSDEAEKRSKESLKSSKKASETVHTADNERANWFILLQALQTMEKSSMLWQKSKLLEDKAALGPKAGVHLPDSIAPWEEHTAVVALQPKRKSWDTMPSEVRKPYATTTICHLIEMAAMLGLHWKEFDRSNHKYLAEGNGYLLTGQNVEDLGIMFHFQIYGSNSFTSHRVIPNDMVKMLAFGNVPTIYGPEPNEGGKRLYDNEDPKASGVLQFGSTEELVESLTNYSCNSKTTNYFRDDKMKHGHLFPVVFEILGMVGHCVYMPNTYYRFIPNPTTFSWNRKNFSLRKLLLEFRHNLNHDHSIRTTYHILQLQDWAENLGLYLKGWAKERDFSMALLRCLHQTIEKCDKFLTSDDSMEMMVQLVVREHIQEVMKLLNEPRSQSKADNEGDDSTLASNDRTPTFEDLNSAAPEVRQGKLMEIYFKTVRPAVIQNCPLALKKRGTGPYVPSVASRSEFDMSSDNDETPVISPAPRSETPQLFVEKPHPEENANTKLRRMPTEKEEDMAEDVWCTLVFRMLCWLLLHDFHKKDVQISKSELYQSRLPVYIA